MSKFNSVLDFFRKDDETYTERRLRQKTEEEGGERATGFHHSNAYHRFFEGYSEKMIARENGRGNRIIREYVGKYYVQDCSDRNWMLCKAAFLVLYAAAVCLFLFALTRRTASNTVLLTAIPSGAALILLVLLLYYMIMFIFSRRRLTAYEYNNGSRKVFLFSTITGGLFCLTAAAVLVFAVICRPSDVLFELSPLPGCLGAAACMAVLAVSSRKMKFRLENNEKGIDESAVVIE
ncbi:MAG: hypothetical protein ACI3XJ_11310 [Oscillospiraceae bacterium]